MYRWTSASWRRPNIDEAHNAAVADRGLLVTVCLPHLQREIDE
jgi:hypothetical protein